MDAVDRTKALKRLMLPVGKLDKNSRNPNKMKAREFDLLVDNITKNGLTDAILVRPLAKGRYRIVGGHHRYDAALYLGFTEVPCTVIEDPAFDEDAENFQLVRMNMIRGHLDPQAFFNLYESLSSKYADNVLVEAFGFADEAEFRKLVLQTANTISDPVMKDKFKEAAKEVKTIDGLARVLNEIFTKFGDTMPLGFMVFDYAGQRSVWIECPEKTMKAFDIVGQICREGSVTVDDVMGGLLQLIAKGQLKDTVAELVAKAQKVKLPPNLQTIPTKQNIEQAAAA